MEIKTSNISRLNSKPGNEKNLMREDNNEVRQYKQQISDGSMALNIKWMLKQPVKTGSVSQAKEPQLLSSNDKISSPRRCSYQSSNGLANSTKMASHGKQGLRTQPGLSWLRLGPCQVGHTWTQTQLDLG